VSLKILPPAFFSGSIFPAIENFQNEIFSACCMFTSSRNYLPGYFYSIISNFQEGRAYAILSAIITESRSEFFYISLEKRKNAISLEQYDRSQKNYVYDDTERVSRVHRPLKYLISKIQDGEGLIRLRDLVCITRYRDFSTLRWRPSVILDIRN